MTDLPISGLADISSVESADIFYIVRLGSPNISYKVTGAQLSTFFLGQVPASPVTSVNGEVGVVVLTTHDIADSANARYVTDSELSDILSIPNLVPNTRTVNGHALSTNVTVSASDVGLGNVVNALQLEASQLTIDGTLSADSDSLVPSEKAVKTYVDNSQSLNVPYVGAIEDVDLGTHDLTATAVIAADGIGGFSDLSSASLSVDNTAITIGDNSGSSAWIYAPDGSASFASGNATIDASGNLAAHSGKFVGSTAGEYDGVFIANTDLTGFSTIRLAETSMGSTADAYLVHWNTMWAGGAAYQTPGSISFETGFDLTGGFNFVTHGANPMGFWTNNTQAIGIDGSQNATFYAQILDTIAVASIDTNNRILYANNGSGTTPMVDWSGTPSASAALSFDFGGVIYVDNGTGNIAAGSWGSPNGFVAINNPLNMQSNTIVGVDSIYDVSNTPSIDASNRQLFTNSGNFNQVVIDYSGNQNSSAPLSFGPGSSAVWIGADLPLQVDNIGGSAGNTTNFYSNVLINNGTSSGNQLDVNGAANFSQAFIGSNLLADAGGIYSPESGNPVFLDTFGNMYMPNGGFYDSTGSPGSVGQLPVNAGSGFVWTNNTALSNPMTTLGDIIYENATPAAARLAGNTTATRKFLRQTGTGSISAAPVWDTLTSADLPAGGVPIIVGNARMTGLTTAQALATYTVGASDTTFQVSANVNITAVTIASFQVTCTYTDETNTSRTLVLNFSQISGTLVQTLTAALGAGAYEGVPLQIRAKAGTTIIIASAAGGTYTSISYNLEERIMQL